MPHFDYCVTVWGDCSDLNKLTKLQKQAARIILDCHYLTPSKDMFCTLKWLPMKDWVKYRKATMTFKAINGNAPDYISSMFKKFTVESLDKLVKMICIFRPGPSLMFTGIRYDTLVR